MIAETLRKDILNDTGISRLKQKTLDLITELRLENGLLNQERTAARRDLNTSGPSVKPINGELEQEASERVLALT